MTIVAIATCSKAPGIDLDEDEAPLLRALRARGLDARLARWEAPEDQHHFEEAALTVLRSTWNYYEDPDRFRRWLRWVDGVSILANPLAACAWNVHKGYLSEIEAAGVPVVPTRWAQRGSAITLDELLAGTGWRSIVVKPTIGAGSYETRVFHAIDDAARSAFAVLTARADTMVQLFLPSVAAGGERALVWLAGESGYGDFTHAIMKRPRFAGGEESVEAVPLTDEYRALGARVLAHLPGGTDGLLYARVDVIRDESGRDALSELEVLEPSLFLARSPGVLDRFADAVVAYARRAERVAQ